MPAITSALLAVLLYAVTLGGTYVYDDVQIVQLDPRVRQVDQWSRLWTTDYFDGGIDNLYRPIVSSSYAIEWWLHGDRPWIFHLVNILLHALAAASVAEFTRRVLQSSSISKSAALSAGLLFAAHPVHVEAVANIVGRAEVACTALIFIGLILLCRRPLTIARVVAIMVIGMIAVLCKEQAILQPLLWLLFGCIIWRSIKSGASTTATDATDVQHETDQLHYATPVKPNAAEKERHAIKLFVLLTTWIWAAYLLIREHFLKFEWDRSYIDPIIQPLIRSHDLDRILMPVVLLGHYTVLLLFPVHLSPDYGGDAIGSVAHFSDPYLGIGAAGILIWIVATLACLRSFLPQRLRGAETSSRVSSLRLGGSAVQKSAKIKLILFCLFSLVVTYGMIGNILTLLATNFADRLMYLPSAFFLIIIAMVVSHIPVKPRVCILFVLLTFASIRTFTAARNWNHPLILFKAGLENQPKSAKLKILLSQQYHQAGDIRAANALLRELCREYPTYWEGWMFRSIEDMDDGDLADADLSLKRAIDLKADPKLIGLRDRLNDLHAATRPATKP